MRSDGFFTERAGGRVAAREVGEGVLLAARASADERRVRNLGYLLAEVVFSPTSMLPWPTGRCCSPGR
ncbi:hypothetical protein ACFQX8_06580 [Klenkia terrae]|uniref:hypothetical protein n=1 Tax=Klenkia terrae TaxID=1052259 RepID=UPI00361DEDDD